MIEGIIIQHIPSFIEGIESKNVYFNSLKELLEIDFVKSWSKEKGFYQYSISKDNFLMAEFDKGKRWYVIGLLERYSNIDLSLLPKWSK